MGEARNIEPVRRVRVGLVDDMDDVRLLLHFTRNWMHFGWIGFIAVCTLIGAVKGLGGVR